MRPCFSFKLAAKDGDPDLLTIYDEIGFWGVQASDFRTSLTAAKAKSLVVEINSPGGDVFAGLAIYNMLVASGKDITTKVMGVAASAASLIAMAGDKIVMPKNTFMMVHNPWGVAIGNAAEMRETADVLDKIGDSLHATYAAKTGLGDDELKAMLAEDTWLTADEALAKGFATEVVDAVEAKAKFDMDRADLPEHIKAIYAKAQTEPETDPTTDPVTDPEPTINDLGLPLEPQAKTIHDAAVKAGLDEDIASHFALHIDKVEDGQARIQAAVEIKQLCAFAKTPDAAAALIKGNKTVAQAREHLIKARAEADQHVTTTRPANQSAATAQTKTSSEVFAARQARRAAKLKKD